VTDRAKHGPTILVPLRSSMVSDPSLALKYQTRVEVTDNDRHPKPITELITGINVFTV
jgi:hypothetical protein